MTKRQIREFEKAVRPIIKFLAENCHPHVTVTIDCATAELSEGLYMFRIEDCWRGEKP